MVTCLVTKVGRLERFPEAHAKRQRENVIEDKDRKIAKTNENELENSVSRPMAKADTKGTFAGNI